MTAKPSVPKDLGSAGRRFWRDVTGTYGLEKHVLPLLLLASRTLDKLDDIAAELAKAPLTVVNAKGDETPHPLLVEQRQQSLTFGRLLAAMRLPDEDGRAPQARGGFRGSYGHLQAVND